MRSDARVIGIDPGLTRCGVAVVSGGGDRPTLVHQACLRTSPSEAPEQRLHQLHADLAEIMRRFTPTAVAVERVLFSANVRTAMATAQAAGIALLAAAQNGAPVTAYSPNEVKLQVAGDGSADKTAVTRLVAAQLGLTQLPRPADVADAMAVALTHLACSRVARLVTGSAAEEQLRDARSQAQRAARGGWEHVLAERGLIGDPAVRSAR